jgi:glycerol-3-phosphate acyltransferase PlsY
MAWAWLLVPLTYLIGSLSFAYWAGRLKGIDLRQHGSGNLGATNAGRVLGMRWFLVVFVLDGLKGLLPVLLASHLERAGASHWLPLSTAAAALIGHSFTCFHGFRGGKAVATSLGLLIALVWKVAALALSVWIVAWLIGRFAVKTSAAAAVAPASMAAALAIPVAVLLTDPHAFSGGHLPVTAFLFGLSTLVLIKHRSNLAKLFRA